MFSKIFKNLKNLRQSNTNLGSSVILQHKRVILRHKVIPSDMVEVGRSYKVLYPGSIGRGVWVSGDDGRNVYLPEGTYDPDFDMTVILKGVMAIGYGLATGILIGGGIGIAMGIVSGMLVVHYFLSKSLHI